MSSAVSSGLSAFKRDFGNICVTRRVSTGSDAGWKHGPLSPYLLEPGGTMPRLITQTVVADFRNRLCDVAAELFTEMGRDGFNMRELAKRLRVSPMTAYRYFRDKDEILAALRARAFARFADRLEAANAAPGSRSAALAQAYAQFVRQDEP